MGRLAKGSGWPNLFSARVTVKLRRCWAREDSQREKWGREKGERLKGLWEAECPREMLLGDHLCSGKPSVKSPRVTNGSLSGFFILCGGTGWI